VVRPYAAEAQAFVISASGILGKNDFPEKWHSIRDSHHASYGWAVGGSAVINPHGRIIAGPLIGEETILYADCHAHHLKLAKAIFDCLGHYTRWDVVRLQVRREPWEPVVEVRKPIIEVAADKLRHISEEYEIAPDKLESLINKLNEPEDT